MHILKQHRKASLLLFALIVQTEKLRYVRLNGKSFLTAKYSLIDIMPDQKYFAEKLRLILIPIQHGAIPIPPMKAVPQEVAEAESCPKPDWNYLRWDGYSDEKYQAILDGNGLLDWKQDGEIHKIELQVSHYMDQNNLDIKMVCWVAVNRSSGKVSR